MSIDKVLKSNYTNKQTIKNNQTKIEDILVLNLSGNLEDIDKSYYRGLKTYIKDGDYELASTVYDRIFEKLKKENQYKKAIEILICAMYLRIYSMLPSDGILYDMDYYEKHLSRLRKYIKKIPKEERAKVIDIKQVGILCSETLEEYLDNRILEKEKVDKFIECLKKYLYK